MNFKQLSLTMAALCAAGGAFGATPKLTFNPDDFTVEQSLLHRQRLGGIDQEGETPRPVLMVTADETRLALVDAAEHTEPVEFHFVQPVIVVGRLLDERGEFHIDVCRQASASSPGSIVVKT